MVNTAKSRQNNAYQFIVDRNANKQEIKEAIEDLFPKVHVVRVNTLISRSRKKRAIRKAKRPFSSVRKNEQNRINLSGSTKKALVKLAPGQSIKFKD